MCVCVAIYIVMIITIMNIIIIVSIDIPSFINIIRTGLNHEYDMINISCNNKELLIPKRCSLYKNNSCYVAQWVINVPILFSQTIL